MILLLLVLSFFNPPPLVRRDAVTLHLRVVRCQACAGKDDIPVEGMVEVYQGWDTTAFYPAIGRWSLVEGQTTIDTKIDAHLTNPLHFQFILLSKDGKQACEGTIPMCWAGHWDIPKKALAGKKEFYVTAKFVRNRFMDVSEGNQ